MCLYSSCDLYFLLYQLQAICLKKIIIIILHKYPEEMGRGEERLVTPG